MVLPVHDVNPTRRTPVVTYLLIAINVVAFLISPLSHHLVGEEPAAQECRTIAFLDRFAAEPKEIIHNRQDPSGVTSRVATDGDTTGCVAQSPPPFEKVPFLSVLTAMSR